MKTDPLPLRLDDEIQTVLEEGVRRTPFPKQELIRLTLRRYLRQVVKQESVPSVKRRLTSISPWPKGSLAAAYRRIGKQWDKFEHKATLAQGRPDFND